MKQIHFIVNPIAGGKNKAILYDLIRSQNIYNNNSIQISTTTHAGHARALARQSITEGYDIVVAVGGDGTVNEIATELINSSVPLAIIPMGSGNGLARDLNIPLRASKALDIAMNGLVKSIDVGKLNQHYFFCTAGLGFDANVATAFSKLPNRGLSNYIRASIKEFVNYKYPEFEIIYPSGQINTKAMMVTIANATQYGNNIHIAPLADLSDGLLDMCIVSPIKFYQLLPFCLSVWAKQAHKMGYIKIKQLNELTIKSAIPISIHVDGEPTATSREATISILPKALKVIVPNK